MMNKNIANLIVLLGASNVFGEYITPPDCIKNYNTYLDKIENESLIENITTYKSISGKQCGNYCNNNSMCTSFNYYPNLVNSNMESKCTLIKSEFNTSYLLEKFDAAFYLKGNNDCSVIQRTELIIIIASCIIFAFCICACFSVNNRKRIEYNSL